MVGGTDEDGARAAAMDERHDSVGSRGEDRAWGADLIILPFFSSHLC